jgi:hypothetical protein
MPQVKNANLTLTTVDSNVTLRVRYQVEFSKFERELARLGLEYFERIAVIGVDPPGSTSGTVLRSFNGQVIPVNTNLIFGSETIERDRSFTVPRAVLQEDPNPGDADEIRCRIRIGTRHMPPEVTPDVFTDQEKLEG